MKKTPSKSRILQLSYKKTIGKLLGVGFLLAGLVAGLVLVSQPQILSEEAAGARCSYADSGACNGKYVGTSCGNGVCKKTGEIKKNGRPVCTCKSGDNSSGDPRLKYCSSQLPYVDRKNCTGVGYSKCMLSNVSGTKEKCQCASGYRKSGTECLKSFAYCSSSRPYVSNSTCEGAGYAKCVVSSQTGPVQCQCASGYRRSGNTCIKS